MPEESIPMDPIEYLWKLLAGDLAGLLADELHAELPDDLRLSDAIFGPYPEPDQWAAMPPEAVVPVVTPEASGC